MEIWYPPKPLEKYSKQTDKIRAMNSLAEKSLVDFFFIASQIFNYRNIPFKTL